MKRDEKEKIGVEKLKWGNRRLSELVLKQWRREFGNSKMEEKMEKIKVKIKKIHKIENKSKVK
jgi:hypothetical protein